MIFPTFAQWLQNVKGKTQDLGKKAVEKVKKWTEKQPPDMSSLEDRGDKPLTVIHINKKLPPTHYSVLPKDYVLSLSKKYMSKNYFVIPMAQERIPLSPMHQFMDSSDIQTPGNVVLGVTLFDQKYAEETYQRLYLKIIHLLRKVQNRKRRYDADGIARALLIEMNRYDSLNLDLIHVTYFINQYYPNVYRQLVRSLGQLGNMVYNLQGKVELKGRMFFDQLEGNEQLLSELEKLESYLKQAPLAFVGRIWSVPYFLKAANVFSSRYQ